MDVVLKKMSYLLRSVAISETGILTYHLYAEELCKARWPIYIKRKSVYNTEV